MIFPDLPGRKTSHKKPLPKKTLKKNPESREDLEHLGVSNLDN
jgi:hypothetical protein